MAAKPSLLAEIKAAAQPKQWQVCGVQKAVEALGVEAADLADALKDLTIKAPIISKVLAGRGIQVSRDVIVRHRRGECKCPMELKP